jgi:phage shock protein E
MAGWLRRVGAFLRGAPSKLLEIPKGARIVDVRSKGEYQTGHFPGAINLPVDQLSRRISELGEKGAPIVVYCRSGHRAGLARQMLEAGGFTNVVNGGTLSAMRRLAPGPSSEEQ